MALAATLVRFKVEFTFLLRLKLMAQLRERLNLTAHGPRVLEPVVTEHELVNAITAPLR